MHVTWDVSKLGLFHVCSLPLVLKPLNSPLVRYGGPAGLVVVLVVVDVVVCITDVVVVKSVAAIDDSAAVCGSMSGVEGEFVVTCGSMLSEVGDVSIFAIASLTGFKFV